MASVKKTKVAFARPAKPLSETLLNKDDTPRTAEKCIEILQSIVKAHPEQVIGRNFFRVHSPITEAVWSAHFGTFAEFKRQSGIILSRQQHNHEKKIAKHASVDHYRRLNEERVQLGEQYIRPAGGRFATAMLCSDLHDKEIDPFFLRVWLDTVRRARPDLVAFVGDLFDLPEFGKYPVDPRDWDVTGRIKFTHDRILGPTREAAPGAQIDVEEGNHEFRLMRHLADATPALRAVLSDLHGMTVSQLLGLDKFEINYIAKADLAAYTERDIGKEISANYKVYWNCLLAHHFPHARNMGIPGVNGHHHRHQVWPMFSPVYGAYEWHQMGCGHSRSASYCEGERWHMGFTIVHVDTTTRATVFEYVQITDHAVVGGQWYSRNAKELGASTPTLVL
jgi:hypothetical protein